MFRFYFTKQSVSETSIFAMNPLGFLSICSYESLRICTVFRTPCWVPHPVDALHEVCRNLGIDDQTAVLPSQKRYLSHPAVVISSVRY